MHAIPIWSKDFYVFSILIRRKDFYVYFEALAYKNRVDEDHVYETEGKDI